jgi:hypothetical protein
LLTIGRLGPVFGSIFTSFMIAHACQPMFILFGISLVLSAGISHVLK